MTVLELLLVTFTSAGVLLLAFFRRVSRSLWRSFAIAGVVLPLAVLIEGRHRALALPMLIVAFIVAALAFADRVGRVLLNLVVAEFSLPHCVSH